MIISNALSISITILNFHDNGSQQDIIIVPDSSIFKHMIKIHCRLDHFSALSLHNPNPHFTHRLQPWPVASSPINKCSSDRGVPHGQQLRPLVTHLGPTGMAECTPTQTAYLLNRLNTPNPDKNEQVLQCRITGHMGSNCCLRTSI